MQPGGCGSSRATPSSPRHRSIRALIKAWIARHKGKLRRISTKRDGPGWVEGCRCTGDRADRAGVVGGNIGAEPRARNSSPTGGRQGLGRNDTKVSGNLDSPSVSRVYFGCEPCRMRMGNVGGGARRRAKRERKKGGNTALRLCAGARRKQARNLGSKLKRYGQKSTGGRGHFRWYKEA